MSRNEKDYSAYISAISFEASTYAFFGGFVFTAITIILTLLPDVSTWQSQATLFFLTLLFHMLLTMLIGHNLLIAWCIRIAPPRPPHARTLELLEPVVWIMLDIAIVLMFLLWNLFYLALASAIMCVLFVIFQQFKLMKPVEEIAKKIIIRK